MADGSTKQDAPDQDATLKRFITQLGKAESAHQERIKRWRKMDDAYHGLVRAAGNPQATKGEVYPKYALAVVETIKAGIIDEKPTLKLIPTTVTQDRIDGAKCLEELIAYQRKVLGFNRERGKFVDQTLIRGIGVAKIPWVYETVMQQKRRFLPQPASPGIVSGYQPVGYSEPQETVTKQGAGYVHVDVFDFMWDPGATRWDDVSHVFYRTYQTVEELRRMKKLGAYAWDEEPVPGSYQPASEVTTTQRNVKDRVEVIERWSYTADGVWLTVVANRNTVLRDCASPLKHQKLPFVVATTNPGLFTVEGMSEVELVMEEQAAIWELLNQSLENAAWQNNAAYFLDDTLRNDDDIVIAPGAKNYLPTGMNLEKAVQSWQPANTLQHAQPLMEWLVTTMNSISPSNPYVSGASADTSVNDTATGISLIQGAAGRRIQRKKEEILDSDREAALQQVALNQQLLPTAVVWAVEDNTEPNGYKQLTVDPYQIQGSYDYDADEVADAVNQQQRRVEAGNFVTVLSGLEQLAASEMRPGLIDLAELAKFYTEAFDEMPDKFLAPPPATPPMVAPAPPVASDPNSAPAPAGGPGASPAIPASPPTGGIGQAGPPTFNRLPNIAGRAA